MRYLLGCIVCAIGWGQTAFIATAQLCPSGQIGSYVVTGSVGTLSLIKFTCIQPPVAPSQPVALTNKNIYLMANCPNITISGDSKTTSFPITHLPVNFVPIIFKNGTPLSSPTDYSIVNSNVIFTVAPLPADTIAVFTTLLVSF